MHVQGSAWCWLAVAPSSVKAQYPPLHQGSFLLQRIPIPDESVLLFAHAAAPTPLASSNEIGTLPDSAVELSVGFATVKSLGKDPQAAPAAGIVTRYLSRTAYYSPQAVLPTHGWHC